VMAHPQFAGFLAGMAAHFQAWREGAAESLKSLEQGCHPKQVIQELSEGLLEHYRDQPLIDAYAVYQLLMDQWADTMQDDVYAISAEGWRAETYRLTETTKAGKVKDKGWTCDLVPKELVVRRFFADDLEMIEGLSAELEEASSRLAELEEEHGGEEGLFAELEKLNKAAVAARIKEIRKDPEADEERRALKEWLEVNEAETTSKRALRSAEAALDDLAYGRYDSLTEAEVRELVVEDKWLATLEQAIAAEVERVSQGLTARLKELGERYGEALPVITERVEELEKRVAGHLERMGFAWS
jgi:type I restriction enzyme M protein